MMECGGECMEQGQLLNHLFDRLDQSASLIAEHERVSYLEALCLTADNIYNSVIKQDALEAQLEPLYEDFFVEGMTGEDVRRALQLTILKGMKEASQPQHQITPDGIALFVSYLIDKLNLPDSYRLMDPVVGTGNLVTAIMNHASQKPGKAYGIEIDDLLINVAHANINLQQQDIELFHQDVLRSLLISPVDLVVADLPVGTYFNKENAKGFQTGQADEPYSHFLIIEQSLKYLNPTGYFVGLIPNQLFESDEQGVLRQLIKDEAYILGVLELPQSFFKDTRYAKSILMLQKKSDEVKPPENALLAKLPSFKDQQAMINMMTKIDDWFKERN